ncbi:MAG: ribonuclease III [Anaerolineae bacterium]|nr:ribonuclease III [Anaerolineae bacterium]
MSYPVTFTDAVVRLLERLQIQPRSVALFLQALTHRSYLNERPEVADLPNNERLEFLGDAVLSFLAARWLYERLPGEREGVLTRLRAAIVGNERLAQHAAELGIGEALLMGKGEAEGGGRTRKRNLSGAFEALLGALYLDQGLSAAQRLLEGYFERALAEIQHAHSDKDARSRLQEWAQMTHNQTPTYQVLAVSGAEHTPTFTVAVFVGDQCYGVGSGSSKRSAAQAAARAALENLGLSEV